MASFIEIDSGLRDRELFVSPADFTIRAEQLDGWFRKARTTKAHQTHQNLKTLEFATSVELRNLITPYAAALADTPRLYVDFHCQDYNDLYLISSIDGVNRDARFVLIQDRIITSDAGVRTLISWNNIHGEQVMRFRRNSPVVIRVFTRDGVTLPIVDNALPLAPNPLAQIFLSFDIRPYIIDASYENQLLETTT